MTRSELTRIHAVLVKCRDAKKLEVNNIRLQTQGDPALDPRLTRAYGDYNNLVNLVDVIGDDLNRLQGVGPGELFDRVSSQPLQDTQEIADGIRNINATLTRILFCLQFHL